MTTGEGGGMPGGGGGMPGGGARRSASWQFAERHVDGLVVAAAADRQGDLVAGPGAG